MNEFWTPAKLVRARVSDKGEVFANVGDFYEGWGLPKTRSNEMRPVLQLVEEMQELVHPRVSTAFQVFRGIAMVASKLHPANTPILYSSVKDVTKSSTKTRRMVRTLELQCLAEAVVKRMQFRKRDVRAFFFPERKKIGQMSEKELDSAIERLTEFLAR